MTERCDIAIAGGGPVGAALAIAFSAAGWAVCLVERRAEPGAGADPRPIALSHGSRLVLERLGAWADLAQATPIERVHVSQRGGFGRVDIAPEDAGVPALGYVTDYDALRAALEARLAASPVKVLWGAGVTGATADADAVRIETDRAGALEARLLAMADGAAHAAGGLPQREHDYGQCAVTALIDAPGAMRGHAWERFSSGGPIALLPFRDRLALVWTLPAAAAAGMAELGDADFLARLQQGFGHMAGEFRAATPRRVYPLKLRYLKRVVAPREVAVGNAAQTLHPVAGQGFNLGLRDAWELARAVGEPPGDPGVADRLAAYAAARRVDRWGTMGFTHLLIEAFGSALPLAAGARGAGLALLAGMPFAKKFVARRMIFGARG